MIIAVSKVVLVNASFCWSSHANSVVHSFTEDQGRDDHCMSYTQQNLDTSQQKQVMSKSHIA